MTTRRPPSRRSYETVRKSTRRTTKGSSCVILDVNLWRSLPMQKPARIKIVNRFGVTRSLPLGNPVFTIGRKGDNDLQLLSDSVSRQHAEIVYENDAYYLVDIGSKRGTFVNGEQVVRCALQHLDLIRVGGDEEQQITFLDDTIE